MTVRPIPAELGVEHSILRQPGRPADPDTTIWQIGPLTLMACGARQYVHDAKDGWVRFKIGTGRRWCTVKLMAHDLYAIEIHRLKGGLDYVVVDQEHNVYAENLPERVREIADREF